MKYSKNEFVQNWDDESDQSLYEDFLIALCEWDEDVDRLDELIALLDSFVGNKEFEKYFSNSEFSDDEEFDFDKEDIPIFHGALDALNILDRMPYYFPSIRRHLIVADNIASCVAVVQYAFIHYNNHLLTYDEDKVIVTSDIFYYLTFFVEDYDNPDNEFVDYDYEYYKGFFKRARKIYWADKKVKKLSKTIRDLRMIIIGMNKLDFHVHDSVYMASIYLMVCNALKNGRDAVCCEDVVVGYLTCYKIIFNDIRPLVYSLYDEDKWGVVNKELSVYEYLDKSPFDNVLEK